MALALARSLAVHRLTPLGFPAQIAPLRAFGPPFLVLPLSSCNPEEKPARIFESFESDGISRAHLIAEAIKNDSPGLRVVSYAY